jgi:hypothetical protein
LKNESEAERNNAMTDALFDPDKPYRARCGYPARIVDHNFMFEGLRSLLVIVSLPDQSEQAFVTSSSGLNLGGFHNYDLVNYTPEWTITRWANVYIDLITLWDNEIDAEKAASLLAFGSAVPVTFTIRDDRSVTVSGGSGAP